MNRAFIVKEQWGNLILSGTKTWEIRGVGTKIRDRVGVIFSGTGMIQGSVEIVGSSLLLREDFDLYKKHHQIICDYDELPYKEPHVWYLKDAVRFEEPIPYQHPQGAVVWVNLWDRI